MGSLPRQQRAQLLQLMLGAYLRNAKRLRNHVGALIEGGTPKSPEKLKRIHFIVEKILQRKKNRTIFDTLSDLMVNLAREGFHVRFNITGISFIALRRLQVYIRLPQSSPPSTVFLPEGPTGSQPPFYESQKLIAWASRTSFFQIPLHFCGISESFSWVPQARLSRGKRQSIYPSQHAGKQPPSQVALR